MIANLPTDPGSYILWLKLNRKRMLEIGRSGEHLFPPGFYAYCGSAFGPGGLKARLSHHLRPSEKPRWHIDYLKNASRVTGIWYSGTPENQEHRFVTSLLECPGAEIIVERFGSSDCTCRTHLLYFPAPISFKTFTDLNPHMKITSTGQPFPPSV